MARRSCAGCCSRPSRRAGSRPAGTGATRTSTSPARSSGAAGSTTATPSRRATSAPFASTASRSRCTPSPPPPHFSAAIERCVNFLGDADSTAAICGQIGGALYGYTAIDDRFKAQLLEWDDAEIALRAALLVARPVRAAPEDESPAPAVAGGHAGGPLPVELPV